MRKLTRDEERFKSCLKKSKQKAIVMDRNSSGQYFWYFPDVEQTGWHPDTIRDLMRDDLVEFGLMDSGHPNGQPRYSNAKWIGG